LADAIAARKRESVPDFEAFCKQYVAFLQDKSVVWVIIRAKGSQCYRTFVLVMQAVKGGNNMSDSQELVEYIMEQLDGLEEVRNIPMMGGYVFYYRERIFGGIYEGGFMVKVTKASKRYMPDSEAEPPYKGAKPMLPVTILEDRAKLQEMVRNMYNELPERKPRRR